MLLHKVILFLSLRIMNQLKSILGTYKNVLIAIAVIFTLTALFVPSNFKGKAPKQSDIVQFQGAASEIVQYRKDEGGTLLWTNALFCGMPAYSISNPTEPVIIKHLRKPTSPYLWSIIFLYIFCAFVMLKSFEVRTWLALIGAIGIGFATENLTILAVGHNTKAAAIGYLPLVIAGCQYLFRKKHLFGLTLLAAGFALQIYVNHVQITYYGGFMVLLFFVFQLVKHIKENRIKEFALAAILATAGAGIAISANSLNLLLLNEYAEDSIRGASALTITKDASDAGNVQNGLTKDYVFSYSTGWTDIIATFIPNYSGGDSDKLGLYYGQIGSTSGPKYIGATMLILMLLGLVLVKGQRKWWLVTTMILTIILSMGGNNFVGINTFMYEHFPLYNKFRAPSMMLVLLQLSVGLMAILGLEQLFRNPTVAKEELKKLRIVAVSGVAIIFLLTFTGTTFNDFNTTPKENEQGQLVYDSDTEYAKNVIKRQGGQPDQISIDRFKDQLSDLRIEAMKKDGFRSLFFIIAVLIVLWLLTNSKLDKKYAIVLLGLLITADLWFVGKRYLNDDYFKKVRTLEQPFVPYQADLAIQQDKSYYRVLDLTQSTLNSNRCANFHKSIGGYSAAKMRRFQDLWDWYLMDDLRSGKVQNNAIFNMLNMKYFIYPNQQKQGGEPQYGENTNSLGNAWILSNIEVVPNADSAILRLRTLDTRSQGIVEQEFEERISTNIAIDSHASITFDKYHPEKLEYTYNSSQESNVAFSEVFYDKGWKAYIDNEPVNHFRLNYVLRGLKVPAGQHAITFEYKPDTYAIGSTLAISFGSVIYLLIGLSLFVWIKAEFTSHKEAA